MGGYGSFGALLNSWQLRFNLKVFRKLAKLLGLRANYPFELGFCVGGWLATSLVHFAQCGLVPIDRPLQLGTVLDKRLRVAYLVQQQLIEASTVLLLQALVCTALRLVI